MKRLSRAVMLMLALFLIIPPEAGAVQLLIPGGQLIGLELYNDAVTVAAFDDTCAAAARDAGLQIGDRILTVDGKAVSSAEDVRQALKSCGSQVTLGLLRGSKELTITFAPTVTREGKRLGVYLRQGIAGVGTVTFYDPESDTFGTLGHGVNDSQGALLRMTRDSSGAAQTRKPSLAPSQKTRPRGSSAPAGGGFRESRCPLPHFPKSSPAPPPSAPLSEATVFGNILWKFSKSIPRTAPTAGTS